MWLRLKSIVSTTPQHQESTVRAWITSVFSLRKLRLTHSVGALVVVAASFFFLHDLGARALEKSDEALYAAGALEMARGGELVYPHQGFARYSLMGKPPGALWPSALSIAVFGRSPFAVRLPTALAGILSVFLVFLIVLKISESLGAALVAVFALLSQGGWLELGRIFWLENTLSAVFLVSFWACSSAMPHWLNTSLGSQPWQHLLLPKFA
jgi:4-amino-4-deoxy-L-arabinose transferase